MEVAIGCYQTLLHFLGQEVKECTVTLRRTRGLVIRTGEANVLVRGADLTGGDAGRRPEEAQGFARPVREHVVAGDAATGRRELVLYIYRHSQVGFQYRTQCMETRIGNINILTIYMFFMYINGNIWYEGS